MSRLPGLKRLFRLPFRTSRLVERDVDDELSAHLALRTDELIGQGVDAEQARRQALEEFGDLDYTRRYCNRMSRRTERRARRWRVFSEVSQDLGFGWRLMRRSPGFTLVTVLALALGIGANTMIFSFVNGAGVWPQGITEPDRLRALDRSGRTGGLSAAELGDRFSYGEFTDYRDHSSVLSGLMAYESKVLDVGGGGETRRVRGALVSSNYFAVLGARIALGRDFSIDEEREPGAHAVAVISHRLWQDRFGADPDVLGTALTLNSRSFIVVGVAAEGFRGHEEWEAHDVWAPLLVFRKASPGRRALMNRLRLVGRLEPGISPALARAEMNALGRQVEQMHPDAGRSADLTLATKPPFGAWDRGDAPVVAMWFAIVGLLLLVVWANISSLFLARIAGRRTEIAVRLALGAGRVRVLRQLLSEGTLLGLLGGAAGVVLVLWWDDVLWIWTLGREEFPRLDLGLDGRVIAFAALLSIVSGTAVALASARRVLRLDSIAAMKGQGGATTRSSPLRSLLVASQLSLSLALLTCTSLVIETMRTSDDPMSVLEPDEVLLASIQPSNQGYTDATARTLYRLLQERVENLPGVRSMSLAQNASTHDDSFFRERVTSGDGEGATDETWIDTDYDIVAPRFFETLGVPLVAGRGFTPDDRDGAAPVIIVNETLAQRLWPGEDPLGKRIAFRQWFSSPDVREVVGLAKDRPSRSGPSPFLYFPLFQTHPWPEDAITLLIRGTGNPMSLLPAVQGEVRALDVNIPVFDPRRFRPGYFDDAFAAWGRLTGVVIGGSGVLALLLAAVALYGVISYGVSERTREIGIRMALGAKRGDVVQQVLRQGMNIALLGIGIGLVATFAIARVLSSLESEMSAIDARVFVGVSLLLAGVVSAASYLPARRAARVDPMEALRAE